MFVIFDLDGTLTDPTHRLHYIQQTPKDWDAFFDACDGDLPKKHTMGVLLALASAGHNVSIWSGRVDRVRDKTESYLKSFMINPLFLTRMRPEGDFMPDKELKRMWLLESISQGLKPDLVFDDRQSVVDMWRAEGIPCFQVDVWEE